MFNKSTNKYFSAVLLLLFLVLAACGGESGTPTGVQVNDPATGPTEVPPDILPVEAATTALGEPFNLRVGESMTIDGTGLTLTFEKVVQDSRCPSAVQCVEDGPVVVVISVAEADKTVAEYEMNPDANVAAFVGIPNIVTHGSYQIELTAVEPHPEQPEDIMNLPYEVMLIVGKGTAQNGNPTTTLSPGETAVVEPGKLSLTFDRVVSDDRCPTEVECEFAGPVLIQVTAVEGGQRSSTFTMNPDPGLVGSDGSGATVVTLSDYAVELTAVDPFPVEIDDPMNMDYQATFTVTNRN